MWWCPSCYMTLVWYAIVLLNNINLFILKCLSTTILCFISVWKWLAWFRVVYFFSLNLNLLVDIIKIWASIIHASIQLCCLYSRVLSCDPKIEVQHACFKVVEIWYIQWCQPETISDVNLKYSVMSTWNIQWCQPETISNVNLKHSVMSTWNIQWCQPLTFTDVNQTLTFRDVNLKHVMSMCNIQWYQPDLKHSVMSTWNINIHVNPKHSVLSI